MDTVKLGCPSGMELYRNLNNDQELLVISRPDSRNFRKFELSSAITCLKLVLHRVDVRLMFITII